MRTGPGEPGPARAGSSPSSEGDGDTGDEVVDEVVDGEVTLLQPFVTDGVTALEVEVEVGSWGSGLGGWGSTATHMRLTCPPLMFKRTRRARGVNGELGGGVQEPPQRPLHQGKPWPS
ncbi:unnamed protein product [Arctogadus glacialis]